MKEERDYDIWVTKEGEHIRIDSMKDSHLENTIPFLERKLPTADLYDYSVSEYIFRMKKELRKRGLKSLIS